MTDYTSLICCTSLEAYFDRMSLGYAESNSNCMDQEHGPRSVVTAIFYRRMKHGSFLSLCIRENHGIVLEFGFKCGSPLML